MQITEVDVILSECIDLGLLRVLWLGRSANVVRSILNFTTFCVSLLLKKKIKSPKNQAK